MIIELLSNLYAQYIKNTEKEAIVQLVSTFLCNLTASVAKGIDCPCIKVYISTRVIKHVYDKRPAEEFDFLLLNVHSVVKFPDRIYKNKSGKRGAYCFVKEIKNKKYLCSIEIITKESTSQCEIVTFFRVRDDYLDSYELLWEWKGGDLHRNAFDSGLTRPSSTPQ
jgi:hypothetical protein